MPRPIEPMERTPTVAKGADMIDSGGMSLLLLKVGFVLHR